MNKTKPQPKISIVTACLNHGEYLEDAILSVMRQGYSNFEHIVVDGVSKDNTLEVLKRYPHVRWISEPDRGQSDALNKGFRMATGDLVGWMNADEYYMPDAFAAMAKAAVENPKIDVFYGDVLFVDKDGRLQRSKTAHDFDFNVLLYYGCFVVTATTFFRRQIFEEQMMLDMDYRVVMDFEYFVRLASQGKKFQYVNQIIGAFRWLGTNASLQHTRRRMERLRVQRTWSPRKMSDRGYDTLAKLYQTKRLLMKTLNGAYPKEWRVLRHAPKQTLWFRTYDSFETCRKLMYTRHSQAMHPKLAS
ncbi:MAG: glycosyltransferase family 2 protein [Candidatus Acidiferrales bacterium]